MLTREEAEEVASALMVEIIKRRETKPDLTAACSTQLPPPSAR